MSWRDLEKSVHPDSPKQTETACAHPWEWYSIDTGFGMWRICPRTMYQPLESGEIQFNNHASLQELRKGLVAGEKHPACIDCWQSEASGGKGLSYRKAFESDIWPERGTSAIKTMGPKWIEVKFSNLCNIKCLTCHSICSSLWEEDVGFTDNVLALMNRDIDPKETQRQFFEWIKANYNDIQSIQLFGGEPVIHDDFYPLLDLILDAPKDATKKQISYSTNGYWPGKFKDKHYEYLYRLFDAGHTVFVRFSIDAVGEQGEYVRTNLNWDTFETNFKEYYNEWYGHPQINRMRCNVALSILNIQYLDTICQWLDDNTPGVIPHYNFVSRPAKFYIKEYGNKLKQVKELVAKQDYRQYGEYQSHIFDMCDNYSSLEPNYDEIRNLKTFLDTYDANKGTDYLKLFPLNEFLFDGI